MRLIISVSSGSVSRFFVLLALMSVSVNNSFAQTSPSVKASVDKNSILIGEQFTYTIKAAFETDKLNLTLPQIPDSLEHFEVVERKKTDSTEVNGLLTCTQSIVFTSFDSGRHAIPQFVVNLDPYLDDTTLNFFTDSIPINVSYAPADSVQTFHDIKPIIEINDEVPWWIYLAGAVILIFLVMILLRIVKKRKKTAPLKQATSRLSPYDEAMAALDDLKRENLSNKSVIKQYHSRLAVIFKNYSSRKQGDNLFGLTSGEFLVKLETGILTQSQFSLLANALRMGDAVKFAKFIPSDDENEFCFKVIRETIETMH